MKTSRKALSAAAATALFSMPFMYGCPYRIAEISPRPAIHYDHYQEQNGVLIALDPFVEEERLRKYFGADLLSEGILPVFVLVENHHPSTSFRFQQDSFSMNKSATAVQPKESTGMKKKQTSNEKQIEFLRKAQQRTIFWAIWGAALIHQKHRIFTKSQVINHNMIKKSLAEKTIYPGTSQSGFVYFPVNMVSDSFNISVAAINTDGGEDLNYSFMVGGK